MPDSKPTSSKEQKTESSSPGNPPRKRIVKKVIRRVVPKGTSTQGKPAAPASKPASKPASPPSAGNGGKAPETQPAPKPSGETKEKPAPEKPKPKPKPAVHRHRRSAEPEEGRMLLGEILMDMAVVTEDQLNEALSVQEEQGGALGDILVELGYATLQDVMLGLGTQQGMEVVDLDNVEISEEVIDRVSSTMANLYRVVPVKFEDGTVTVAMADARNMAALDDLKFMLNVDVSGAISNEEAITRAIKKYYGNKMETFEDLMAELDDDLDESAYSGGLSNSAIDISDLEQMAESVPVIKLLNLYLLQAIKAQASDIHFEPFEDDFKVRYRIDGALYEMMPPPRHLALPLISRIKVMANMDISERRLPQDNRIELSIGGNPIDLRVSTLPTKFGESVVMRVLDRRVVSLDLDQVGMREEEIALFRSLIGKPNGIVLVTGPTGSGKTTTLYSALNDINDTETKIITTEDPVEYDIEGIVQIQVNPEIGVSFANCLRAILRQDPDAILVGEIRDLETAQIAIQASLTGHVVFSTLHTNDAPQTVTRLIDMGLESFLISATLEGVIAQRLVRKICRNCKQDYEPSEETLMELSLLPEQVAGKKFYTGAGCELCNNTGYKGRTAIYEMMLVDDRIRDLIAQEASTSVLRDVSREQGMRALRDSGLLAIYDGVTTIEEVVAATHMAD